MMTTSTMATIRNIALITAICLGTFMATLDISIVNVALPAIQQALQVNLTGLQWVIDAYALCLSALILSTGVLGDRLGRKRLWLCGVWLFILGSAVCAFASGIGTLLTGRVLQGIGAAAVIPGALSLLSHAIPEEQRRVRVIGIWSAVSGIALIAGPTAGGILVHIFGWPAIFWVNLPIGALTLLLGLWSITESTDHQHTVLNLYGQLLSIATLAILTWGLISAGAVGWHHTRTLLLLAIAILLLCLFIFEESNARQPLMPLTLLRNRGFMVFNLASFILGFSSYTSVFFISLLLQKIYHLSAAAAGLGMAPQFVAMTVASSLFGRLAIRTGIPLLQIIGYALMALALLLLAVLPATEAYTPLLVLLILLGFGNGLAVPATSALIMRTVTPQLSGLASSVMNALRQTGMTLGIALLGSLMNQQAVICLKSMLQQEGIPQADAAASTLILLQQTVTDGSLSSLNPQKLQQLIRYALHHGFNSAMLLAGLCCTLLTLLLLIQQKKISIQ